MKDQRKDFHHKLSRKLAEEYDVIAVEDLNMKGKSGSLHLGKGVMDNAYGMFRNMLEYKLAEQGKTYISIDRFFPSSKKCRRCGRIKEKIPLSEWEYICECGNRMDRDVNADPLIHPVLPTNLILPAFLNRVILCCIPAFTRLVPYSAHQIKVKTPEYLPL